MRFRRTFLAAVAVPSALVFAYACSSDPTETPPVTGEDSGGGNPDGSTQNDTGTNPLPDGSIPGDGGTDAADAAVTCVGNPLTDGGTPDGGASPEAGLRPLTITYPFIVASSFLDGPQWIENDAGGALVFTQVSSDPARVLRVAIDGGAATTVRSGPNGQGELPIGNAARNNEIYTVVADNGAGNGGSIWRTRLNGDAGAPILVPPSTNPNDLVITANGTIFFTDPQYQTNPAGATALYRVATDGGVQQVQTNLARPNGIALSQDGLKLFVGLGPLPGDPGGAAKGVLTYAVTAAGVATAPGTPFLAASDLTDTPDGLAVDIGGNLWVAEAAGNGDSSGRVEVFSPTKVKLGTLAFPTERPTGIAFGGPGDKTVFITTETNVWVYPSRCAGVR